MSAKRDGTVLPLTMLIDSRHVLSGNAYSSRTGFGPWTGPFRGLKRGQGMDFDDLRPYADGDDVRHIDWKVTARYNTPFTRLYREEKDHVITLAVDFRQIMFTGSSQLRAVQAGRIVAALLWQAVHTGSRCGIVVLSDAGVAAIPAIGGERGALAGCSFLCKEFDRAWHQSDSDTNNALHMQAVSAPTVLCNWLLEQGRMIGDVLLASGFDQTMQQWQSGLHRLAQAKRRPFNLGAIHIVDPLEIQPLPAGLYTYNAKGHSRRVRITPSQSIELESKLQSQRHSLRESLEQSGLSYFTTAEGFEPCLADVASLGNFS